MATSTEWGYDGFDGRRVARTWPNDNPRFIALLCHGYGEHIGRYDHIAGRLVEGGAVVHGVDHVGHGKSDGEPVLINDFEGVLRDFRLLDLHARELNPALPVVLIGHSMGGLIATRYAQEHGEALAALILSAPVLGRWDVVQRLLAYAEIPDEPVDPDTLSRDPEVGRRYAEDPLVWHGPFKRATLQALQRCIERISAGPALAPPTLWLHGTADQLVPIDGTREGINSLGGPRLREIVYPDARHEIFNDTNRDQVLGDVIAFIDEVLAD